MPLVGQVYLVSHVMWNWKIMPGFFVYDSWSYQPLLSKSVLLSVIATNRFDHSAICHQVTNYCTSFVPCGEIFDLDFSIDFKPTLSKEFYTVYVLFFSVNKLIETDILWERFCELGCFDVLCITSDRDVLFINICDIAGCNISKICFIGLKSKYWNWAAALCLIF